MCVLVPLVLTVLLTETSASPPFSEGAETPAARCPPRWLQFGLRCFAFYPVWSSWSDADSLCYRSGGNLASIHTPDERWFVGRLVKTNSPAWLGARQSKQNASWSWSDGSPFRISGWTNQREGRIGEGGACMQMTAGGGLHIAPCGELGFYICSTAASNRKPAGPDETTIVHGVSLFDVVWGHSDGLAEEILRSSSFLRRLRDGQLTQRCYAHVSQQEALYLHRVSQTLEVLLSGLQEVDDVTSLLMDTLKHYGGRNQSLDASPPPPWLRYSLQSFHSVVLEEPVYWLVALSARYCLQTSNLVAGGLLRTETRTGSEVDPTDPEWMGASLKEADWTHRYRQVLEKNCDRADVFKAKDIFRVHMMNLKSFYRAVDCDEEDTR